MGACIGGASAEPDAALRCLLGHALSAGRSETPLCALFARWAPPGSLTLLMDVCGHAPEEAVRAYLRALRAPPPSAHLVLAVWTSAKNLRCGPLRALAAECWPPVLAAVTPEMWTGCASEVLSQGVYAWDTLVVLRDNVPDFCRYVRRACLRVTHYDRKHRCRYSPESILHQLVDQQTVPLRCHDCIKWAFRTWDI